NQFVESLANTYLPQLSVMHDKCGYGCSDHASWHNQGYATSMPFESRLGDDNPYIHSSKDTYANSGNQAQHALKFTRLALAFAVELGGNGSGDDTPPPPSGDDVLANGVPKTGLSGGSGSTVLYKIEVPAGAHNLVISTSGGSGDVDLYTRY
ncbi:M28 family peptidase, partial [Staphylococcus aureus]|uniref:M28 family peptidase n=1 Tax=Staphylococcus aureus TaxID=1280 RepID=UPI0035C89109